MQIYIHSQVLLLIKVAAINLIFSYQNTIQQIQPSDLIFRWIFPQISQYADLII